MKKTKPFLALMITLCALISVITSTMNTAALGISTYVVSVLEDNSPPVAKNLELNTFKDVNVSGSLEAVDPDGDEVIFTVVTGPTKGTLEIGDDGAFTYSPADGKKGRDSFTYTACDDHGNVSAPAEVRINIKKQTVKITYSDMDSEPSHYAALVLAEKGIYTGEQIAGCCFFRPGESVSRSEFLAMCMSVSGDELLTGVTATGFFDDSDISDWAKPYVSTALMSGSISGIRNAEGHLVFAPSEDITVSQAALMLNGVFSVSDVVSASSLDGEGELSPTAQAMENLRSCGIISDGAAALGDEPLTRAQAAMMLCSAIEKLDR